MSQNTQWKIGTANEITVVVDAVVNLKAYYILENSTTSVYTQIPDVFIRYGDRYVCSHTFNSLDTYIIKIVDSTGTMNQLVSKVEVVQELLSASITNIASDVWLEPSRTLTQTDTDVNVVSVNNIAVSSPDDFKDGMTVSDIWNYATRTVHSDNELTAAAVWSHIGRSLDTTVDSNLVTFNGVGVTLNDFKATISAVDLTGIPAAVWNYATRTVVSDNELTAQSIWNYANRGLTDKTSDIVSVNGVATTGIANFQADTVNVDLTGIAADVWNYATRDLTVYDTNVNVTSVNNIAVTSPDDFKSNLTALQNSVLSIPTSVWDYSTKNISNANTLSASDIWAYNTRGLTDKDANIISVNGALTTNINDFKATNVTIDTSLLASDVWSYATRDLTNYGSQITASDVWSNPSRILTDKTVDVTKVNGLPVVLNDFKADVSLLANIPQNVWAYNTRGLTQNLGIPTTSEIWNYASRTITNNDVNITSVNGNLVTSPDDFKSDLTSLTSSVSSIPTNVWSNITRDLTNKDANIISVNSVPTVSVNDFKAITDIVDLTLTTNSIKTKVDTLINYDDSTLTSLVQAIKTLEIDERAKLLSLINYDDANLKLAVINKPTLELDERAKLLSLDNYDDTGINTKLDDKPNLVEIESSLVLAKKSDTDIISAIVNSLPQLTELRNEMINVNFGGLEILNNQCTIKDQNGTVIAIYDLLDKNGNPTTSGAVYKRINV